MILTLPAQYENSDPTTPLRSLSHLNSPPRLFRVLSHSTTCTLPTEKAKPPPLEDCLRTHRNHVAQPVHAYWNTAYDGFLGSLTGTPVTFPLLTSPCAWSSWKGFRCLSVHTCRSAMAQVLLGISVPSFLAGHLQVTFICLRGTVKNEKSKKTEGHRQTHA